MFRLNLLRFAILAEQVILEPLLPISTLQARTEGASSTLLRTLFGATSAITLCILERALRGYVYSYVELCAKLRLPFWIS